MTANIQRLRGLVHESQRRVLGSHEVKLVKKLQEDLVKLSQDFNPEDAIQFLIDYYYQMEHQKLDLNLEISRELK